MDFETGVNLTRWSIGAAIWCWSLRVLVDIWQWRFGVVRSRDSVRLMRIVWTVGAVCLAAHVLLAFGVHHNWSHAAAYAHTAERTFETTGWRWGGGLWFNHLMLAWWVADAALWWGRGLEFPKRARRWTQAMHAYFGFMVFNATVVFGPPGWRFIGLIVVGTVVVGALVDPRKR